MWLNACSAGGATWEIRVKCHKCFKEHHIQGAAVKPHVQPHNFTFCWPCIMLWFLVNDKHDAQFFTMYLFLFLTLYTFRAHRDHHQERQIVSTQPLVTVTLCRWPCCLQVGSEFTSDLHTTQPPTQSDSYQRLGRHNLPLLMMSTVCSKHVES
jgi:hypothetical protein